jgi:hypothetical protein
MLTVSAEVRNADGNLTSSSPPKESRTQKWIKAAEKSDDIARVLKHFGEPTNWYDMWTAYEIIEADLLLKGDKKTKKGRALLRSRNWVSEDDLHKFAESCNYHRHGEKKPPTPEQSSTTDEVGQILTRILQSWLEEKVP